LRSLLKDLASLRLTVGLLAWLAFMCIMGTLIPQEPLRSMGHVPPAGRVLALLSLKDVFHSLWFLIPAGILALNMAACMYLRKMGIPVSRPPAKMPATGLTRWNLSGERDPRQVGEALTGLLGSTHRTVRQEEGGRLVVMGERGALRAYAPLLVHASILMVMLGAGLGLLGFKGTLEIPVGRSADMVTLGDGNSLRLPYQVRCDDFRVQYYENGMPKEYRSELSFISGGVTVEKASVLVNHPVKHERVLFSQSGYNPNPVAALRVDSPQGSREFSGSEGSIIELQEKGCRVHVVRVLEDIMHMGPAVQLVVETPGARQELWVFREFERILADHPGITEKMPGFNPSLVKPYTFTLRGVTESYSTVLGINRDPGIVFVGLGSVVFLAGIIIAFMVAHDRIWFALEQDDRGLCLTAVRRTNGKSSELDPSTVEIIKALGGTKTP
jgi:cytochrome c biogenesis protein